MNDFPSTGDLIALAFVLGLVSAMVVTETLMLAARVRVKALRIEERPSAIPRRRV